MWKRNISNNKQSKANYPSKNVFRKSFGIDNFVLSKNGPIEIHFSISQLFLSIWKRERKKNEMNNSFEFNGQTIEHLN